MRKYIGRVFSGLALIDNATLSVIHPNGGHDNKGVRYGRTAPALEHSAIRHRGDRTRLVYLLVILLLASANCNGRRGEGDRAGLPKAESPLTAQSQQLASDVLIPSVEEVVFVSVDTVLVFPGCLRGIANEEVVNRDRAPLMTQDGGDTWNRLSPQAIKFKSINYNNSSHGWLVNEDAELWKTTNRGVTWNLVSRIEDGKNLLGLSQQIDFTNELNGWILDLDSLWQTEDGGNTWLRHKFPGLASRFFLKDNAVWVASQYESERNNVVFRSRDRGLTWDEVEVPNTMSDRLFDSIDVRSMFFLDEQRGWLANTQSVYRTEDGGYSWRMQRLPGKEIEIESLCFLNEEEGWASGWKVLSKKEDRFEAVLLHTTNGGETWQHVDTAIEERSFEKVYFGDPQNGWLVSTGRVYAAPGEAVEAGSVYRTGDGGRSWKKVLSVKSPYAPE